MAAEQVLDFWVGMITAGPVLLVFFAEAMRDLLVRNGDTRFHPDRAFNRLEKGKPALSYYWIWLWVVSTPILIGALTVWAAVGLYLGRDTGRLEAVGLLVVVVFATISGGFESHWLNTLKDPDASPAPVVARPDSATDRTENPPAGAAASGPP